MSPDPETPAADRGAGGRRSPIPRGPRLVRHLDAGSFFEDFLISAITAILGIRAFLHLTGYPQVGGEALHIAHMLWGGLLMAVAILLLFGFIGRPVKVVASIVGGLGFGTFIDELGKFVTRDNNYFFEPTFALIYVVFVLMYVSFRAVHVRPPAPQELVANALEIAQEAVRGHLDPSERERALDLLEAAGRADPFAAALADALRTRPATAAEEVHPLARIKGVVRDVYRHLAAQVWFTHAVIAFFIGYSIAMLVKALVNLREAAPLLLILIAALIAVPGILRRMNDSALRRALVVTVVLALAIVPGLLITGPSLPGFSWSQWGELVFSVVPALLVVAGVVRMRESRLEAYRMYERAVLILIFVTQFFAFYQQQLGALAGLLLNILVLAVLRTMLWQEARLEHRVR